MRPWFIANCDEHISNIKIIGETFENELIDCTDMEFDFNDQKFDMHLRTFLMMDSKLIDLATGLGGAYCTCCTASEEEALSLENINRGRFKYLQIYSALRYEKSPIQYYYIIIMT